MYHTILAGILGVSLMVLTACESMTGKTTGQTIDDATVTTSVQGKLTGDQMSNFSRINVETERSVVTLNGVVRTVEEKSRAEDLALRVAGVRAVNNNLQIQSLAENANAPTETQDSDKQKTQEMEGDQSQHVYDIKGEVIRVEGDTYFVKGEEGKEVRLHTDHTTQKMGDINQGDRIEGQMNEENHALSIRSAPTTDRRNEHNMNQLCTRNTQSKDQSVDNTDGCSK